MNLVADHEPLGLWCFCSHVNAAATVGSLAARERFAYFAGIAIRVVGAVLDGVSSERAVLAESLGAESVSVPAAAGGAGARRFELLQALRGELAAETRQAGLRALEAQRGAQLGAGAQVLARGFGVLEPRLGEFELRVRGARIVEFDARDRGELRIGALHEPRQAAGPIAEHEALVGAEFEVRRRIVGLRFELRTPRADLEAEVHRRAQRTEPRLQGFIRGRLQAFSQCARDLVRAGLVAELQALVGAGERRVRDRRRVGVGFRQQLRHGLEAFGAPVDDVLRRQTLDGIQGALRVGRLDGQRARLIEEDVSPDRVVGERALHVEQRRRERRAPRR
jgi:hypothetical protein